MKTWTCGSCHEKNDWDQKAKTITIGRRGGIDIEWGLECPHCKARKGLGSESFETMPPLVNRFEDCVTRSN